MFQLRGHFGAAAKKVLLISRAICFGNFLLLVHPRKNTSTSWPPRSKFGLSAAVAALGRKCQRSSSLVFAGFAFPVLLLLSSSLSSLSDHHRHHHHQKDDTAHTCSADHFLFGLWPLFLSQLCSQCSHSFSFIVCRFSRRLPRPPPLLLLIIIIAGPCLLFSLFLKTKPINWPSRVCGGRGGGGNNDRRGNSFYPEKWCRNK